MSYIEYAYIDDGSIAFIYMNQRGILMSGDVKELNEIAWLMQADGMIYNKELECVTC